jgi:hypothetical protein
MKTLALVSLLVVASCATSKNSVSDSPVDAGVAQTQFEKIKTLAGEWTGTGGDGSQSFPMVVHYRVTAAGNAVEETLFVGTEHEMITLYHLDGDHLMLTHYCATGNQPRMVARSTDNDLGASTIQFDFVDATNLASPKDGHMHAAEMTFGNAGHLEARWTYFQNGERSHQAQFDLTRKSG